MRPVPRQLPDDRLRARFALLPVRLTFLFRRPRRKNQRKRDRLIMAGRIQHRFLRTGRKSRKLRANHIAAILRNGQRPRAADVSGCGIPLPGERILRGYRHTGQRNVAALHLAMQTAPCHDLNLLSLN